MWAYPGTAQFLDTPIISEMGKPVKLGLPKISRATYWANRTGIFAIAQLSLFSLT